MVSKICNINSTHNNKYSSHCTCTLHVKKEVSPRMFVGHIFHFVKHVMQPFAMSSMVVMAITYVGDGSVPQF